MKAVMVFCEGRHDVVFAQRSLGTHGNCSWVIDNKRHDGDKVSGSNSNAKRLKAIITVAGQFNHPGCSLSVIMEEHERNGIPQEQFEECAVRKELAHFLLKAPLA